MKPLKIALLFCASWGVLAVPATERPELPRLSVRLTPHATGGADSYMGVSETLSAPGLPAGGALVHLPIKLVGIPGSALLDPGLIARDASGPLALNIEQEPPTPQGQYRSWHVARATVGDVVVSYHAAPRAVTAATNNGPLFDLREEAGGFAGAGVTFFAAPPGDHPYRITLDWDLSQSPTGSRAVSSFGEGHVELVGPAERLVFAFYAAGPLHSLPGGDENFNLYWLSTPAFSPDILGGRIKSLHASMARFFGDPVGAYRIFVRQNPFPGTGGTALPQSFMFGYRAADEPTVESLQSLLSHEMAHNWPAMQGEHGATAWYSEGTAEYYSMLLSYRAGVLPFDAFVDSLNEKMAAYYTNPYLHLSNAAAAKLFWSDPIAQTVPYGRGLLYLIGTDVAVRNSSRGKRSLDDIVVELYHREKAGQPYTIDTWLDLVGREIGKARAKADYEAMAGGQALAPGDRFPGCLVAKPRVMRTFELGFDRASLNDDRIVHGLKPGSEAERAGIRDGDVIVAESGLIEARKDETKTLQLTIKHDGVERTITYLPRGAEVNGLIWVKVPTQPSTASTIDDHCPA